MCLLHFQGYLQKWRGARPSATSKAHVVTGGETLAPARGGVTGIEGGQGRVNKGRVHKEDVVGTFIGRFHKTF